MQRSSKNWGLILMTSNKIYCELSPKERLIFWFSDRLKKFLNIIKRGGEIEKDKKPAG